MDETSEKHEDILKYEADALRELRRDWSEYEGEHRRRTDLVKGTAFGLILGTMGNLFVQFLSPVIEAFLLGEYKPIFAGNFVVCAVSLVSIVSVSAYFCWQQTRDNKRLESLRRNLEIVEYAIKRRQYSLEQTGEAQQQDTRLRRNAGTN